MVKVRPNFSLVLWDWTTFTFHNRTSTVSGNNAVIMPALLESTTHNSAGRFSYTPWYICEYIGRQIIGHALSESWLQRSNTTHLTSLVLTNLDAQSRLFSSSLFKCSYKEYTLLYLIEANHRLMMLYIMINIFLSTSLFIRRAAGAELWHQPDRATL